MNPINGDSYIYRLNFPVTDDEYAAALAGTISSFVRIGSQGFANLQLSMMKDDNNKRPITIVENYVTQFHGLTLDDANSQGYETVQDLQNNLNLIYGHTIDDSQPITIAKFVLV